MDTRSPLLKLLGALATGVALILASGMPAAAHVGLSADSYAAGSTSMVTFGFGHGCGDSPTTSLAIQIPEEFTTVQPVYAPGWHIEVEKETLATPVAGSHGQQITERPAVITFTADEPIENGIYAMVTLRVTIPEGLEGETFYFPVIQGCSEGESAWIEIPQDGQDAHDLESPAPSMTITAADDDH
ncbi:MAG: YcnI family protein [Thermomicrobiales bacterium]|nr:YcnI family protein [Thermomicrobiales bacterium]